MTRAGAWQSGFPGPPGLKLSRRHISGIDGCSGVTAHYLQTLPGSQALLPSLPFGCVAAAAGLAGVGLDGLTDDLGADGAGGAVWVGALGVGFLAPFCMGKAFCGLDPMEPLWTAFGAGVGVALMVCCDFASPGAGPVTLAGVWPALAGWVWAGCALGAGWLPEAGWSTMV